MKIKLTLSVAILLFLTSASAFAAEAAGQLAEGGLRQVEQYNFSIHILAMLLVNWCF